MRLATTPASGRLPLDDPPTDLDPLPVGMPHQQTSYLWPEATYGYEQRSVYPTKRALMLVSKTWAELAVEFMYESLAMGPPWLGGRSSKLITRFEYSIGFRVWKKWVKRLDIYYGNTEDRKDAHATFGRIGLPNLRVHYLFDVFGRTVNPSPSGVPKQPLHIVMQNGYPAYARLVSRPEAFRTLRSLTLSLILGPSPTSLRLPPNLRRLTIHAHRAISAQAFSTAFDSVVLPNVTHFTLHHFDFKSNQGISFMGLINRIGPQLCHLTLTEPFRALHWTPADLCTILRVCPQLTELVTTSLIGPLELDASEYQHPNLQTLGIPIRRGTGAVDYRSFFEIFSRREAFPSLRTMRVVTLDVKLEDIQADQWLESYRPRLKAHGISLEVPLDRNPLLLPYQNQPPSSGRGDVVS